MKKLSLNRIQSGNSDIKDKVAYGDFIVIDNYLIIRESITNLLIYKFSGKDTLTYYKEIPLKYKNEIKSMDGINPNNIFIIYHTKEIYVIDIINSTQAKVKINMNQKISLLEGNEISIHDQCELKDCNKSIYIGFVSVNNRQLYLAYKDWNNDNDYILNCIFIKNFKDEIIHIEYKFLTVKKEGNTKTYCFICILCKMEGYTLIVEVKEGEYDLNKLISLLILEANWSLLFTENNIISYNYSFYYNLNSYEQNSILIFTDENKCMIWNFKSELNDPKDFLIKTELIYKREKGYNKIIDVNHYNKSLFVTTKEELIEYKLLSSLTTSINVFKHTNPTIFKIAIYDVLNLIYILFLTPSDLWYYQIDLNEGHHRKTGSNLSLSGLDNNNINIDKEIKSNENNNIKIPNDNLKININSFGNDKGSNKQYRRRESIMKNNNEQINRIKCSSNDCGKFAKFRCSLCQNFFICEQGMHTNLWDDHKKNCPKLQQKKKMEYDKSTLAPYVPLWNKQRVEIVAHLRKKEFSEAIEKNYILIQENYKLLIQYEREAKILPFDDLSVLENNKKYILSSFQYYEDYFCNFLLLIQSFSLFKSKDEVWRLLNRLIKEMEIYNFMNVTNFLIEENIEKIKSDDNQDNYYSNINIKKEFGDIYLRILKILVTIAKYGNSLGEFSFYEKFLLDYTLKILKAYSDDEYITYNTYLLLGNLYVEYGFLQKGNKLFDSIISYCDVNNLNNKERLNDVVLCANYNSGLINFVIDRYEIAKQRFENALRIKKEYLKEKNDLQISQIYETIAEIDIENKNYTSASINLQKAIESRELSNTMDVEFKLRTDELKNYIYQNLGDTKGELNSNIQFRRGENTEENEINELILDFAQDDTNIDLNQPPDIPELEKFFLFMTKLSTSQIDKLNEDQPKDNFEKNKRFPIVFSKNFKNSLTHSQRLALCDLKLTSLTRVNVLKNYTKKISIRNLNYNALNLVPPENNLNSIRNSYVTKTILHNWEARKEEAKKEEELKNVQEEEKSEEEGEEEEEEEIDKIKENGSFKVDMEDNKSRITIKKEEESDKLEITSEENIDELEDKDDFDYNGLLSSIKKYCEQNAKEKAKYVDNKFLFLLCREGKMTKEELKRIEKNPELIELLLDTYIEMIKESNEVESKESQQQQKKDESKEFFIQPDTKAVDDGEINKEFFKDDNEYGGSIPIPPPPPPPPVFKFKSIKPKNNKGKN